MENIAFWLNSRASDVPLSFKILLAVIFLGVLAFYLWVFRFLYRETLRGQPFRLRTRRRRLWSRKLY